jgi:hypothetical protein
MDYDVNAGGEYRDIAVFLETGYFYSNQTCKNTVAGRAAFLQCSTARWNERRGGVLGIATERRINGRSQG